jgi:catechol 2,3-dioxygenase-like lactoylglutathione lyase family enzyme
MAQLALNHVTVIVTDLPRSLDFYQKLFGLTIIERLPFKSVGAWSTGNRAADAVILGVQNGSGDWIAFAAATPISPLQYLAQSTRMDLEFLPISGPRKRGEWEIDIPFVLLSQIRSGVIRAWAMDYPRHVLYRLPGDQRFTVAPEQDPPPKLNALGAAGPTPAQ